MGRHQGKHFLSMARVQIQSPALRSAGPRTHASFPFLVLRRAREKHGDWPRSEAQRLLATVYGARISPGQPPFPDAVFAGTAVSHQQEHRAELLASLGALALRE